MCSILEGRCLKGGITGFSAHFFLKSNCFNIFNYYWCVLNWCFIFKSDSYFSFKIFGTKKRNPNDQATIRNLIKNIVYHFTSKDWSFPHPSCAKLHKLLRRQLPQQQLPAPGFTLQNKPNHPGGGKTPHHCASKVQILLETFCRPPSKSTELHQTACSCVLCPRTFSESFSDNKHERTPHPAEKGLCTEVCAALYAVYAFVARPQTVQRAQTAASSASVVAHHTSMAPSFVLLWFYHALYTGRGMQNTRVWRDATSCILRVLVLFAKTGNLIIVQTTVQQLH